MDIGSVDLDLEMVDKQRLVGKAGMCAGAGIKGKADMVVVVIVDREWIACTAASTPT